MAEAKKKKARVLVACEFGQPNDVVEIDAAQEKGLVDVIDASPEAVAYAESLAAGQ
ncbi:hypothetical protein [Massilia sp. YIM B02443]|uniref:hypothetical protein n=1 Tax=Massilia sp. YIM B02443 TaxID=3050127 RepID=UPI0025B6DEA2|nr:hypothetical protein [Massilia sp. YIM B02443]MDN4038651.1 hypothetical protein [Massilia sp. YIM B02443]